MKLTACFWHFDNWQWGRSSITNGPESGVGEFERRNATCLSYCVRRANKLHDGMVLAAHYRPAVKSWTSE